MGFTLDKVVPWGRSYDEYINMFSLTEADLELRLLGCGDGPAGFNSVLTQQGGDVVSVDPVYSFNTQQIKERIDETYSAIMAQMHKNHSDYIWDAIPSVEQLGNIRMSAMETFLADFDSGKHEGRYITAKLPLLPFKTGEFDLALSSHFLFLYSEHLSVEFHLQALQEMLRVAREVRIFPLLTLNAALSPHLVFVQEHLISQGFKLDIKQVNYEFQRGANEMLVIKPA